MPIVDILWITGAYAVNKSAWRINRGEKHPFSWLYQTSRSAQLVDTRPPCHPGQRLLPLHKSMTCPNFEAETVSENDSKYAITSIQTASRRGVNCCTHDLLPSQDGIGECFGICLAQNVVAPINIRVDPSPILRPI